MKKKIFLAIFVSIISFPSFLDGIREMDQYLQKNDYENAYKVAKDIEKTELSKDDRKVLESIIEEIESKLPKKEEITEIIKEENTEDETKVPVSPTIPKTSPAKFAEYKAHEKEILASKNSQVINDYAKLYVRSGLLESAMNFALKDPNRSVENIYLAATAARMIGEYDKAISLYNEVLNKNPNNSKAILGLAVSYKSKQDFYKAVKYLKKYSQFNNSPEIQEQIRILQTLE